MELLAEDLDMAGTIHRLDGEHTLFALVLVAHREHVVAELLPMARSLPQRAVDELWRPHFGIPGLLEAAAQIALDDAIKRPALRVPEDAAHRLFLLVEEIELAAQAPVIAFVGF